MINKNTIQKYVNSYRRYLSRFLKPGFGLSCTIYNAEKDGVILEFTIGEKITNSDSYKNVSTVGSSLATLNQQGFGGNLENFIFKGTNTILEPNRIIYIKDNSESEWSDQSAERDVNIVLQAKPGNKK